MEMVKKFWPLSALVKMGEYLSFVGVFLMYTALAVAVDLVQFYGPETVWLGFVMGIACLLFDAYIIVGLILSALNLMGADILLSKSKEAQLTEEEEEGLPMTITELGAVKSCPHCSERIDLYHPDGTEVVYLPRCPYCGGKIKRQ